MAGQFRRALTRITSGAAAVAMIAAVAFAPTASAASATVMATTQKMSQPTLNSTQSGTYPVGKALNLVCYTAGQAVKGYYSAYFDGGWDTMWYKTSDGYYVADVDLNTGTNNPKTPRCSIPTINSWSWYNVTARISGLRMDIRGGAKTSGTAVQQYTANTTSSQKFNLIDNADGSYRIVSALTSSQVISVKGSGTTNGSLIETRSWSGSSSQRWIIKGASVSGYYTLRPKNATSKCLDVPGGSKTSGKQLQIYTCNNTSSQMFKFSRLSTATSKAAKVDSFIFDTRGVRWATSSDRYPGECVSLVSMYLKRVYNITTGAWGNAVNYRSGGGTGGSQLAAQGFAWSTSSTDLKDGDILVWKGGYGGYGHIGIWYHGKVYDQNDKRHSPAQTANYSDGGPLWTDITYVGRWRK